MDVTTFFSFIIIYYSETNMFRGDPPLLQSVALIYVNAVYNTSKDNAKKL